MTYRRKLNAGFASLLIAFCIATSGCGPQIKAVEDLNQITATYARFQDALNNRTGTEAIACVSQSSIDRFQQFCDWAVNDSVAQLEQRSILEQIEVLRLRHFFTPDELQTATGSDIIALLVDRDQLPTPFVRDTLLSEPVFQEDRCYLMMFDQFGPVKEKVTFVVEEGNWKLDLPAMEHVLEKIYGGMKQKQNLTQAEVVEKLTQQWDDKLRQQVNSPRDGQIMPHQRKQ